MMRRLALTMGLLVPALVGCGPSDGEIQAACEAWVEAYNALDCVDSSTAKNAATECATSDEQGQQNQVRSGSLCSDAEIAQMDLDYYACAEQTTTCEDTDDDGALDPVEAADSCRVVTCGERGSTNVRVE